MKCLSCDVILTDSEAVRKYKSTGEFVDLCDSCFDSVKEFIDATDQEVNEDFEDDEPL